MTCRRKKMKTTIAGESKRRSGKVTRLGTLQTNIFFKKQASVKAMDSYIMAWETKKIGRPIKDRQV